MRLFRSSPVIGGVGVWSITIQWLRGHVTNKVKFKLTQDNSIRKLKAEDVRARKAELKAKLEIGGYIIDGIDTIVCKA